MKYLYKKVYLGFAIMLIAFFLIDGTLKILGLIGLVDIKITLNSINYLRIITVLLVIYSIIRNEFTNEEEGKTKRKSITKLEKAIIIIAFITMIFWYITLFAVVFSK